MNLRPVHPVRRSIGRRLTARSAPPPALAAAGVVLLTGPASAQNVARPVDPDQTASSRVVVALQPVGRVEYDGLCLPVTSPSGEYIASQTGRAPSWETVLGAGRQSPPAGVRLSVQRIEYPDAPDVPRPSSDKPAGPTPAAKPPRLTAVQFPTPLPPGLLLGRGADDLGFLVEAPQPGGARWVGRVHWIGGRVDWLARPEAVCAHATLAPDHPRGPDEAAGPATPRPIVAYVQRPITPDGSGLFSRLVVVARDGGSQTLIERSAAPGESFTFPVFSADGRTVGVFAMFGGGGGDASGAAPVASCTLQLVAFELRFVGGLAGQGELVEIARLDLGSAPGRAGDGPAIDALHASYQCVAAMQAPPVMPGGSTGAVASAFAEALMVFSPRDAAVVAWMPRTDGLLTTARGSFAAVPFAHSGFGLLLAGPNLSAPRRAAARPNSRGAGRDEGAGTAPTGAVNYQEVAFDRADSSDLRLARPVEVVAGRMIPRATRHAAGHGDARLTVLLADPKSGGGSHFDVVLMSPARTE